MQDQLRMLKIACSQVCVLLSLLPASVHRSLFYSTRSLRNRDKLENVNTPQDVVELIRKSKNILILTGAGVSVGHLLLPSHLSPLPDLLPLQTSCGIPDFRSPTGLYARLKEENWDLDDPQDMFDLSYFKQKPNVFYGFAKVRSSSSLTIILITFVI
jgi:hypothetical protein